MLQGVNADLLTVQLKAAMPNCGGIVYANGSDFVDVVFADEPSESDIATAQMVCAAHDPTQQSAAQIAAAAALAAQQQQQITIGTELAKIEADLTKVATATLADLPSVIAALQTVATSLASTVHVIGTLVQQ
jgi:hypothetical protein